MDRCKISNRNSIYVIHAIVEALGYDVNDITINKSSMHRYRRVHRQETAYDIQQTFKNGIPKHVTVHWDGKLIAAPNVRDKPKERLPIILSSEKGEQILRIPAIPRSTGK